MEIKLARVINNEDLSRNGMLECSSYQLDEHDVNVAEIFTVFYSTPVGVGKEGGFIAIPDVGQICTICKPDNVPYWIYMNSVYGIPTKGEDLFYAPEDSLFGPSDKKSLPKRTQTYTKSGNPKTQSWSTKNGNRIELCDNNDEGISYAGIISQRKKKITLSDSAGGDGIIIENEHGDKIAITSDPSKIGGHRSIGLECQGNIVIKSIDGGIDIQTQGQDINITNTATGSLASRIYGNINIRSYTGDVNVNSYTEGGQINLLSPSGSINMKAQDINLDASGGINMKAVSGINIATLGIFNLDSIEAILKNIPIISLYSAVGFVDDPLIPKTYLKPPLLSYEAIELPQNDFNE